MKSNKIIYGVFAIFFFGIIGCNKEAIVSIEKEVDFKLMQKNSTYKSFELKEENRSFVWVNDKLDCSEKGVGCVVKSQYKGKEGVIDLSLIQVMKLINIGKENLNKYFCENDLSYEFPSLYEKEFIEKISSNSYNLTFEFPYFKVISDRGEIVKIYNYENYIIEPCIIEMLKDQGDYTHKISLSTTPGSVWKCLEPGDNCKVSKVKYDAKWLASNPEFLFIPKFEEIKSVEVDGDINSQRILITTVYDNVFGIEY